MSRSKALARRRVPDRAARAALADVYARQHLEAWVTNRGDVSVEQTDRALLALTRRSPYWNDAAWRETSGDIINACWEAGLLLGLAYGRRLR